jgi:hypothetical protein
MKANTLRQTTVDVIYENLRPYNAKLRTASAGNLDIQEA